MNYLNLFLLFLIAVYILEGWYRGFLVSAGNTIGMAGAWIVGFLFCPALSRTIAQGSFYRFVYIFTEASSHLADQIEGHQIVADLSQQQIQDIVSQAALPAPFDRLVFDNMRNVVYGTQYKTVAEYFNYTVTDAVVNILSFLVLYAICRVIVGLILNTANFASPLPVLKHLDGLCGGAIGALRGCLGMYAICLLLPIILISAPANITLFSDIIYGSSVASAFYQTDFLLNFIPGTIS